MSSKLKTKLEYIWLDGYKPTQSLRSKTKIGRDFDGTIADCPVDKFSFGISDRGASIRVPIATVENGWNGWLEDRRPNSAADPYKVAARIIKTVKTVPEYALVNGR